MKAIYTNAKILIKTQYIANASHPVKYPSPYADCGTDFERMYFY